MAHAGVTAGRDRPDHRAHGHAGHGLPRHRLPHPAGARRGPTPGATTWRPPAAASSSPCRTRAPRSRPATRDGILVVGTEVMSSIIDFAGPQQLHPVRRRRRRGRRRARGRGPSGGIIDTIHHIDGVGRPVPVPARPAAASCRPRRDRRARSCTWSTRKGRDVYKYAVKGMADVTAEILERNGLTGADVDLFVPHQANIRIIEAAQQRRGPAATSRSWSPSTASATRPPPASLGAARRRATRVACRKGDTVVLCRFGAGFTWGATLLRWTAP